MMSESETEVTHASEQTEPGAVDHARDFGGAELPSSGGGHERAFSATRLLMLLDTLDGAGVIGTSTSTM